MRLDDLVTTSRRTSETRSRLEKTAALSALLRRLAPEEIDPAVAWLSGHLRQGRIGLGPAAIRDASPGTAAAEPSLTVGEVDAAFDRIASTSGPGSTSERARQLSALLARAKAGVKDILKTDRQFRVNVSTLGGEKVGRNLERIPSQVLRENVFVAPFHEEDFREIVDHVGATQVLYGSDWPHPEGVAQPLDMMSDLAELTDAEVRLVAHDNTANLLKISA